MPVSVRVIFGIAAVLFISGLVLWKAPFLISWFGKLPGDIHHQGRNSRVFFPITSMVVISVLLTLIVNLLRWFFGK